MRDWLRHLVVCSVVGALVLGGAWQQCMALPAAPTAAVVSQHDHHHGSMTADAADHDHGGHGKTAMASDQNVPPAYDHTCLKCCSVCTVASLALNDPVAPVIFSTSAISFGIGQRVLVGHDVALDPGIPKPIV